MNKKQLLSLAAWIAMVGTACNAQSSADWQTLENGLEYKIVKKGDGKQLPKPGDVGEISVIYKLGDSTVINTMEMTGGPVQQPFAESKQRGDLMAGLMKMKAGDSAVFRILVDTLFSINNQQLPPWITAGDGSYALWEVKMFSVKDQEQIAKETTEANQKQMEIDDKIIQDYIKQHNLQNAIKTESGLYYVIVQEGNGEQPKQGQNVTVNYTGKLVDGTAFDSNTDPQFNHVEPFSFPVGAGRVIKGWDEGVISMKKGEKRILLIPSPLAYGQRNQGPIPANSVLIFDVELIDFK